MTTTELTGISRKIVDFLERAATRPMRLSEIVRALGVNSSGHCSKLLKNLAARGIIAQIEEYGVVLYWRVAECITASVDNVINIAVDNVINSDVAAPVNMLTNFSEQTEQTTGFLNFEDSQAEVSASPGREEAGQAVGQVTSAPRPAAPALPFPPEATESPKIADFKAPSEVITRKPPKRNVAPPAAPQADSQPTLVEIADGKHHIGEVFVTVNPFDALYQMEANMDGKIVPDPDYEIGDLSDVGRKPKMIPAFEAFGKYVRIIWDLLRRSGAKGATDTYDFVIHRAAYLFVNPPWEEIHRPPESPESLIAEAMARGPNKPIYTTLLGIVKDIYIDAAYGWEESKPVYGKLLWSEELKRMGKDKARRVLFPSYNHAAGKKIKAADDLRKRAGIVPKHQDEHSAKPVSSAPPPDLHPVFAEVRNKLGEQRFDFWFQDAALKTEGGKAVICVRNNFSINSIRLHCNAELEEALKYCGLPVQYHFEVMPPKPEKTRASPQAMRGESEHSLTPQGRKEHAYA